MLLCYLLYIQSLKWTIAIQNNHSPFICLTEPVKQSIFFYSLVQRVNEPFSIHLVHLTNNVARNGFLTSISQIIPFYLCSTLQIPTPYPMHISTNKTSPYYTFCIRNTQSSNFIHLRVQSIPEKHFSTPITRNSSPASIGSCVSR